MLSMLDFVIHSSRGLTMAYAPRAKTEAEYVGLVSLDESHPLIDSGGNSLILPKAIKVEPIVVKRRKACICSHFGTACITRKAYFIKRRDDGHKTEERNQKVAARRLALRH